MLEELNQKLEKTKEIIITSRDDALKAYEDATVLLMKIDRLKKAMQKIAEREGLR